MRHFQNLIHRFARDESGAFAMIFAIMAIALVAMSGAVVDFTSMQQSRTKAQVALDAAALALQPNIYTDSTSKLQSEAQALLVDRLADAATVWKDCGASGHDNPPPCVHVATPVADTTNGQLTFDAEITVPMNFVSLVGVDKLTAQIESVATRKKLNLEVAMVLDNSGSMSTQFGGWGSTRLSVLKSAANCAVNILFYGVSDCSASTTGLTQNPTVKMALVPFNDEVNIGAGNATADWIDRTGASGSFANDNFRSTNTQAATGVDRIALFSEMSYNAGTSRHPNYQPLAWGGCVEARYNNGLDKQYDTDDTTPVSSDPSTLFVPLFAPDEPDSGSFSNNYLSDTGGSCTGTAPTSQRTLQERLCKYNGAKLSAKPSFGKGPNVDCPATAVQPLTTDVPTITAAIGSMVANGNTNIQEGTAWGFRVLSPTEPFTEGLPYSEATSKVLIVMTDGENTYNVSSNMNGSSLYAAYAYPWDNYMGGTTSRGRMGNNGWSESQFTAQINSRLATTCANAKAMGITIYTIGLATDQTSDPTGNTTLLTNCASAPDDAYFPTTSDELVGAFQSIANQLAALRLAK